MTEEQIRAYASTKGFHHRTLERWLSWKPADRDTLLGLALALKLGENHLRDLMDWLEEIELRDRLPIAEVLQNDSITSLQTDPRLGRGDRLKRIKDQVRRLRFPRLSQLEDAIQTQIRKLGLHPRVSISVPPGLEGGALRIEFSAATREELESLIGKIDSAAKSQPMAEIFLLLRGESNKEAERAAR